MAKIPYPKSDKRSDRSFPALQLTKKDPALAAMLSKTLRGRDPVQHNAEGNRRPAVEDANLFHTALQRRGRRNADAESVLRLLPDIEMSAQILTSSIQSPKEMGAPELIYIPKKDLLKSELAAACMEVCKNAFEEQYKISSLIPAMLREPLFEKGSYPVAVIPENAIDEMINGTRKITTESLSQFVDSNQMPINLGILGSYKNGGQVSKPGLSFESFAGGKDQDTDVSATRIHYYDSNWDEYSKYTTEEYISVTDNPAVLKFPKLTNRLRELSVGNCYKNNGLKTSLESHAPEINDFQVEQAIFRQRTGHQERASAVPHQYELKRKSVGNPLIMKLPSEAVIPVHVPNNPKEHVGYFIMLDEEGNPIEMHDGQMTQPGLQRGSNGALSSNIMRRANSNMSETDGYDPFNAASMKNAYRIYGDLIERDLIARVKNGRSAAAVAVARNEEVYRLMLSRVMAQRYTQLLYVPVEYMTYIAFMYSEDGLGQSLLDRQSMLNTIRATLLFSDTLAKVKNSIGRTKVSVTLDSEDAQPLKALEHVMDEIVRGRALNIPLGMSQPSDIMEFIQRAGFEWDLSGHPGMPDLKIEFIEAATQHPGADSDLQERLRKASIMGFGLSPETVDNGFNAEFATTAVANNILLAKRVIQWQDIFTPQLSDHLRKIAINTESIVTQIKELLEKSFDGINLKIEDIDGGVEAKGDDAFNKRLIISHALHLFLKGFSVELPRPSSVTLETQLKDMKDYSDFLEEGLNAYLTSDLFMEGFVGDLSKETGNIRALYKAYFMRQWMADKGILPELAELISDVSTDALDSNIIKGITSNLQIMTRMATKTIVDLKANADAANKDLAKHNIDVSGGNAEAGGGGSGFGGGGGSFGGGDSFGSDLGGFDAGSGDGLGDLNLDSDPGLDDLDTAANAPEEDLSTDKNTTTDDFPNTKIEPNTEEGSGQP